jgi:hypothetical protein
MRSLATTKLALCGGLLVFGCSGGAGPATPPFSPFGSEPSGGSSEPSGASNEMPGGTGQPSLDTLCAEVCARFGEACPSTAMTNCAGSCSADATQYPSCLADLRAFLVCADTAAITCSSSGSLGIDSCGSSETALSNCLAAGQSATGASG